MEVVETVSIVVASLVAILGINAWRREHVGTRRVELAEDTLALFYEANDVIRHIRHPASFGEETAHITRKDDEDQKSFEARRNASIVFVRYDKNKELFNKIYAARYRFMAQFGKDSAKPFDDLHKITAEIFSAAQVLARLWKQEHFRTPTAEREHFERIQEQENIFWEGLPDTDPINSRLDKIIKDIEAICGREIETWESSLWNRLRKRWTRA